MGHAEIDCRSSHSPPWHALTCIFDFQRLGLLWRFRGPSYAFETPLSPQNQPFTTQSDAGKPRNTVCLLSFIQKIENTFPFPFPFLSCIF